MAEADTRDAEAVIAEIEAEFRMACKAARKFMAFYGAEDTPRGLRNGSPDMWSGSRRVNLLRPVIVASAQSFPGKWIDWISFSCRSRENLAARILWSGIKPRDLTLSVPIGGFVKKGPAHIRDDNQAAPWRTSGHEFSGRYRLLCDGRFGLHCAAGCRKALSAT